MTMKVIQEKLVHNASAGIKTVVPRDHLGGINQGTVKPV